MMNWPCALMLIFCECIACFSCWFDPNPTDPGIPVFLLVLTTGLSISLLIFFYRTDLSNRLPRSAITTRPTGGGSDQEGMGEVQKGDPVSALAERGPHSAPSGHASSEPLAYGSQEGFVHARDCRSWPCQLIWWLCGRR